MISLHEQLDGEAIRQKDVRKLVVILVIKELMLVKAITFLELFLIRTLMTPYPIINLIFLLIFLEIRQIQLFH